MEAEKRVVMLDVNDVLPNRFQPRIQFEESAIQELSDSIKRYGVIQPIIVRPIADKYEIIAGERRYKATVLANLPTIPAIILNLNDKESAEIALIENVQRRDLTPIEEAVTYKKVLDMGNVTQEELADRLGVKQSTVSSKLRLLNLDDEVQTALLEGKISERHARSLLKLPQKDKQRNLLERIIKERLTVRRTDEEIKRIVDSKDEEKEVEILDLDNIFNEEGEDKMNPNDPMNQFNIPTPTISDDVEENNMGTQAAPFPSDKPNLMAPGFLDIDKIEKEAQDIGINNGMESKPKFFNLDSEPTTNNVVQPQTVEPAISPFSSVAQIEPSPLVSPQMAPGTQAPIPPAPPVQQEMPAPMPQGMPIPQAQPMAPGPQVPPPIMPQTPIPPAPPVQQEMPAPMPQGMPIPQVQPMAPGPQVPPQVMPQAPIPPTPPVPPTTMGESYVEPVLKPVTSINMEFMDAIQSVHDLKDDLENRGFIVSVEENNLTNEYHFIIKVSKQG